MEMTVEWADTYQACPYCGIEVEYGEIDWCRECDVCVEGETITRSYDDDDYDYYENDGQPDEYTEWQDYMGGDDWDQGQYDDY